MQLEAQELKEKEGQEGSESQEDTGEAKTEGQDAQGTQQPEGAKAKSRVLASVGDGMQCGMGARGVPARTHTLRSFPAITADVRPRAFSSGAQLQTPTKEEVNYCMPGLDR
jgi:hypothetical protein